MEETIRDAWNKLTKTQKEFEYGTFENFKKIYIKENNIKSKSKSKSEVKVKKEKNFEESKKSSPSKIIWWILGIVSFIIFMIMFLSGGNNSNYKSGSSKGYNTGRDYIPLVNENGIWGTRCYYSNGKVLEIESPRSVQIQGGWPPKCPAKY